MTAAELVKALEARGVRLTVHGGRLRVDAPRGALTPEDRRLLEACRDDILRLLGAGAALGVLVGVGSVGPISGGYTHTRTPEARCAGCGAGLTPEEIPAGVCEGCAQAVVVAPTGPDPEAFHRLLAELEAFAGLENRGFRIKR
jgi:sugar phosphate isomerase/epimerase